MAVVTVICSLWIFMANCCGSFFHVWSCIMSCVWWVLSGIAITSMELVALPFTVCTIKRIDLITAHTPISTQSDNFVVFRLQASVLLSASL